MEKSKGRSHYFKGNEFYYLKEVLPYIKKKCPTLKIPDCWKTGGSLNEKVRADYGIMPAWTNQILGRGHREKYTGNSMYLIADHLIQDLKDGNIQRRQSRSLTPIEQLASGDPNNPDDFLLAIDNSAPIIVPMYAPTPREDLEKAIREATDELVNAFQSFMNKVFEAYKAST